MKRFFLALLVLFLTSPAAHGAEMTYAQARQSLRPRQLPEFWVGDTGTLPAVWEKLARGRVQTIARSPGGRPLSLVTFGRSNRWFWENPLDSASWPFRTEAELAQCRRASETLDSASP